MFVVCAMRDLKSNGFLGVGLVSARPLSFGGCFCKVSCFIVISFDVSGEPFLFDLSFAEIGFFEENGKELPWKYRIRLLGRQVQIV